VISGPVVATGLPTSRIVPDLHRGFAVDAQALDLPRLAGFFLRYGLPVFFRDVGEDGVRFWEFFWGLALTTLRRR
jgi:hypothetical protein